MKVKEISKYSELKYFKEAKIFSTKLKNKNTSPKCVGRSESNVYKEIHNIECTADAVQPRTTSKAHLRELRNR